MARVREKYGRGVAGLALWQRIVITIAASVPAAFWFFVSLFTTAPGNALTLAVAVLFAAPLYVLVPALWERTEESVRTDWHARRVEKQLELEVGVRERAPRIDHDRPVPKRW